MNKPTQMIYLLKKTRATAFNYWVKENQTLSSGNCWIPVSSGYFVLPCIKKQILVQIPGPVSAFESTKALSNSPSRTVYLLESPPCSWNCTGRHRKSSGHGVNVPFRRRWTSFATFVWSGYHLMLRVVTWTLPNAKLVGTSILKRWGGEKNIYGLHI